MKILFNSYQSISLMKGGPTYKIIQLKKSLEKIGVSVELFNQWKQINYTDFDLVHIFNAHSGTYHFSESLKLSGIKYVVNPIYFSKHSSSKIRLYLKAQKIVKKLLNGTLSEIAMAQEICKNAELVLPNTNNEKMLIKNGLGIVEKKLTTIPNGVEKRFLFAQPDYFKVKYKMTDFILHVGHIGANRKNTYNLLQAVLKIDHPLVIIGNVLNNSEGVKCMKIIQNASNILHLDWVDHDDDLLKSAYAACNTFVLPSKYETPGRAALEAALAGAKIVITPNGGTREYFRDMAYYCNPNSIDDIKAKITESLNDKNPGKLSAHISKNYLWDKIADQTKLVYTQLINNF